LSVPGLLRKGATAALIVAALGSVARAGGDSRSSARHVGGHVSACRFEKPAAWSGGKTFWTGGCARGHAEGLGVLENAVGSSSPELFAGYVRNGFLRRGVLITEGGYVAGDWRNGAVVQKPGDVVAKRNVTLRAFETAAEAADAASRTVARSDAGRSRFFSDVATRMRNQMD
jgi:hypothetical protein